jgi:solute carrier family 25 2-oxodicarboxylate transporter 21
MVEAPKRATKFAANEQYTRLIKSFTNRKDIGNSLSILTGIMAGITEALVVAPFELVKIRMQDKNKVSLMLTYYQV